MIDSIID